MLIGVFVYFSLAVVVLALICLPPLRDRVGAALSDLWQRGRRKGVAWRTREARQAARVVASAREALRRARENLRRRARVLAAALALIVALPLGAGLLRGIFRADSFDPDASRAVDPHVAELLEGEDLAPPPPLPPEFFMTSEVEAWQPLARSASRQWDLLDERFRQRLLLGFKLMHERYGYEMVLIEGFRSAQRQAALAALGPTVTRAGPFESAHQFGLAADCAFLRDGHIVISEKEPWAMAGYERYGEVARSLGLVWGGDWRGLRDLGHVELHRPRAEPGGGDNRAMKSSSSR